MSRREPEPPSALRERQEAFTAYLRERAGEGRPEGLDARGGEVYRRLVYNNLEGFLAANFPVLRRILDDQRWHALVADFLAEHRAQSPYFLDIGREFLDYLAGGRGARDGDPPFLAELAHYEWAELALSVDEAEVPSAGVDPEGDLLAGRPVVSPLAWALQYAFPVHRIGPGFQPAEPPAEPTFLVVYRGRDDAVGFLAINAVTARLLQLLEEGGGDSGEALLRRIAGEIGHADPAQVVAAGADILDDLRRRGIVAGTAT
ncbi:MAG TPA: putative DNA-binding domain-containing protein [Gammaproteobacteria bacterium]|nr:putative DNA-binding domain-containing protein [Gammaproteobacteria bacterium]